MQEDLLLEIETICKTNDVAFSWRHNSICGICHCIFTKDNKSINYGISYSAILYQPKWLTIQEMKTCITELCN